MRGRQTSDPSRPHESRSDYWGVVLDALDPPALIRFYAELLEWRIVKSDPEWATAAPPEGVTGLAVQRSSSYERPSWPNEAGKPQMMHLDNLPQPFTVSQARCALQTKRRVALLLLAHLVAIGRTLRLPGDGSAYGQRRDDAFVAGTR